MMGGLSSIRQQSALVLGVFSLTLLLSASLMFALQPMIGKMLMPLIGGTPTGWIVALSFFQIMLLGGYFLAHVLSRFTPRKHAAFFIAALALGAAFLPVDLNARADMVTDNPSAFSIFALLFVTLGLPFGVMSATSSTVQRLFTATGHRSAGDPYFLYAASNLGSFGGLLAYPFFIERNWGLLAQSQGWFYGYAALVVMGLLCLALTAPSKVEAEEKSSAPAITGRQRLRWILLAFVPSSLMMGVTTHVTTDIFSAPLVWIFPLGLYLLTFVFAFARFRIVSQRMLNVLHPAMVIVAIGISILNLAPNFSVSWWAALIHMVTFTVVTLSCHFALADTRPAANSRRHLTDFYLMLSIGGALGGILNAFILPLVLDRSMEYHAMMIVSLMFLPAFRQMPDFKNRHVQIGLAIALAGFALYFPIVMQWMTAESQSTLKTTVNFAILGIFASLWITNLRALFVGCFALMLMSQILLSKYTVETVRNFFGVVRVLDLPIQLDGSIFLARTLSHGSTTHGLQVMHNNYEAKLTTYYTATGPLGDIFSFYSPKDILAIGVGVGTVNCYSNPDNAFTFIDIDADVVALARKHFTYLSICEGRRKHQMIIGDGRMAMDKLEDQTFDLIILDAFSADNIPVHLLTREALEKYLQHLKPGGLILFNISNRYFNLGSAIAATAESLNIHSRIKTDPYPSVPYGTPSVWMAVGRGDVDFTALDDFGWGIMMQRAPRPWTDDFTDLMSVMYPPSASF
jgi:SAM-dependent methyltransferase